MSFKTQKNNYLRQIAAISKSCGVYHKSIVKRLKVDLEDYLDDHSEATEESIQQHFGHPEEYVKEYLTGMTSEEIALNLSTKRFRRKLVITVTAVFLILTIALFLWVGIRNSRSATEYYSYELIDEGITPLQERNHYG